MTKDLTVGNPLGIILKFSIPLILGNIFQQMYNLVDTIIVGRYLGITALSAMGATASLNYLIIGFCTGICSGFSIPVAQQFGAKKYDQMRKLIMNGVYISVFFTVIITGITFFQCRNILLFVKTPEEILNQSSLYLKIIFAGLPATFLYNMAAGVLRAIGDSKTPFYFLVVSTIVNIVLDLVLIVYGNMGIAGAAYATVVSQLLSGILCLIYIIRGFELLKPQAHEKDIDIRCLKTLFTMGVPLGLQSSITAVGTVMLQSSINSLGMLYISVNTAVTKIKQFTITPYGAVDVALTTYVSQNYGAGDKKRVAAGVKAGLLIYGIYSIVIAAVLILMGDKIALIFVDSSEREVLSCVKQFFGYCGYFYIAITVLNCFRAVIQGLGHSTASLFAGLCELASRACMALIFIPAYGFIAVCFTDGMSWVTAGICVVILYIKFWKKMN